MFSYARSYTAAETQRCYLYLFTLPKRGRSLRPVLRATYFRERETGFEPATSTMANLFESHVFSAFNGLRVPNPAKSGQKAAPVAPYGTRSAPSKMVESLSVGSRSRMTLVLYFVVRESMYSIITGYRVAVSASSSFSFMVICVA